MKSDSNGNFLNHIFFDIPTPMENWKCDFHFHSLGNVMGITFPRGIQFICTSLSESKTALETDRRTLRINLIAEKLFHTVYGNVCSHYYWDSSLEVDTRVTNNGGRGNSGCPYAKRNLWNLELPTTRRESEDPCLGWIKLGPIGTHPQTDFTKCQHT